MKYIIIIAVVVTVFISAGTVLAASVVKNAVVAGKVWGYVGDLKQENKVYRLVDAENNNVCYFAYGVQNAMPVMSCVHGD